MRFHDVVRDVFGSREKVSVLKVLTKTPNTERTSNELAKLAGVSVRGAINILSFFSEYGLVERRRIGNAILWRINPKSVIYEDLVKTTFEFEERLLERLVGDLKQGLAGVKVNSAFVFGSVAKGNEKPNSDIDIILEGTKKIPESLKTTRIQMIEKYGNCPSFITLDKKDPFLKEAKKNSIVLVSA